MPVWARPTSPSAACSSFKNDVLDILAHVPGFGQRGGIDDRKGNVQHAGQRLRQQRLAGAGRTDQHDVRLGQLDAVAGRLAVHVDALVVVVDRHRQLLLGLLLPDDVLVEEGLYFLRLGKLVRSGDCRGCRAVIFQDGIADRYALVANVGPRIIAGGRNQFRDRVLRFVAERTAQDFVCARPVFHSALLLRFHPRSGLPLALFAQSAGRPLLAETCRELTGERRSYLYFVL